MHWRGFQTFEVFYFRVPSGAHPLKVLCCFRIIDIIVGIWETRLGWDASTIARKAHCLDVRQLMELAGKVDSFVQISRQHDQRMPGTETVPSIRGTSQGRRADLKRKAADITRSSCETFAFLTTKNFSRGDAGDVFSTFCNVSVDC